MPLGLSLGIGSSLSAGGWIAQPAGFSWPDGPSIAAAGAVYSTTFDLDVHRPATSVTYYIDPVAGSDAADGLSEITPRKKLSTTVVVANAGGVAAKFLCKPGIYHGDVGWNGATPTVSFILEPWAADPTAASNRIFLVRPPAISSTWFIDSGAVYRPDSFFVTEPHAIFDLSSILDGFPRRIVAVADKPTCAATPGSYWRDSAASRIYVHAFDSRVLTGETRIVVVTTGGGNNLSINSAVDLTLWVQNVCCIDGSNAVYIRPAGTGLTIKSCMRDVTGIGVASGDGIGHRVLQTSCAMTVYLERCGAAYNMNDGIDVRCEAAGSTLHYFENECFTARNGYDASAANNSVTAHGTAVGISLNGAYAGSQDRCINDINTSMRWMLGCTVAASAGAGASAITVQAGSASGSHTAQIWLDGCSIAESTTGDIYAETGCAVRYRNMPAPTAPGGAGTIESY